MPYTPSPLASLVRGLAFTGLLGAAWLPGLAQADTAGPEARSYTIGPGPLDVVLRQFAERAGLMLSLDARQTEGRHSQGLDGVYSVNGGVQSILAGTGFTHRLSGNTLLLESAGDDSGVQLAPLDIMAGRGAPDDAPYLRAGSSHHLSEERIQRFRGTSVGDIFKSTPGVISGDSRAAGNALDINIRGMQGMNRVPVVVDGSQQQNTVYRDYAGIAGRTYLDPDLIGGIDISKGPTSGVEGVGAVGGVVSMRTLVPDDIIRDGEDWGLRLRGGVSTNSSAPPPATSKGGINRALAGDYLVGCSAGLPASQCRLQNVPEYGYQVERPSLLSSEGGYGSLVLAGRSEHIELLGAWSRRKVGNYHAGERGPNAPGMLASTWRQDSIRNYPGEWRDYVRLGPSQLNPFREGEEVLNTSSDTTSWLLKGILHLPGEQTLELSQMSYRSDYGYIGPAQLMWGKTAIQAPLSEVGIDTHTVRYRWDPDNPLLQLRANAWRTRTDLDEATMSIPIGSRPPVLGVAEFDNLKWGVDLANTSQLSVRGTELSLDYGLTRSRERLDGNTQRQGTRLEESAFLAGEWTPLSWLRLEAATRHTRYASRDRRDGFKGGDSGSVPTFGVTFLPWEGVQVYVRHAEALRMPALFEMTSQGSGEQIPRNSTPPKPEHAKNLELGLNVAMDGLLDEQDRLRLKLAWFRNHVDDYITRTNSIETPSLWVLTNIDRAHFRGYELSAEYGQPRWHGAFSATYYTRQQYCVDHPMAAIGKSCSDDGAGRGTDQFALIHVPPRVAASLELGGNFFDQALDLDLRVNYIGRRPDTRIAVMDVRWPSVVITDLHAGYRLTRQLSLDLNVDNLTDRYYMDALTLGMMPSPGRTLRAGFTWQW